MNFSTPTIQHKPIDFGGTATVAVNVGSGSTAGTVAGFTPSGFNTAPAGGSTGGTVGMA